MRVQRNQVAEFLKDSPSLRRELPEQVAIAYETARLKAADETNLDLAMFPEVCEWTVEEALSL
jgi:hypothetical protein